MHLKVKTMKNTILYLFIFVAAQLLTGFAANTISKLWFPETDSSTILLISSATCSIFVIILFTILKWCPVSRNYIRTRPWGTLIWSALFAIGAIIPITWAQEFIPETWRQDLIGETLAEMLKSREGYFIICVLAPLAEEIVFRGAIIRALTKWWKEKGKSNVSSEWYAIVISSILFAAVHANPAQIPAALVFGIFLGWLFVKTGSIFPGTIVHWINNSFAYVMLNLFPTLPIDAKMADYFNGNQLAVAQAVIASLLIALPSLYQLIKTPRCTPRISEI